MGAPEQVIEDAERHAAENVSDDFELFEDNVQSATVFQRMGTQWRRAGMDGIRTGLDYNVVEMVMRRCGVPPGKRNQVFEDVQTMESETLKVDVEKRK